MIVLLWLVLIFIPIVIGEGLLTVFYRRNRREQATVLEGFVLGGITCIGVSEVAHVMGLFLNYSITKTGRILFFMFVALALVSLLLIVANVWKQEGFGKAGKGPACERTIFPFVFMAVVLFQALFIFCREPIMIPGDITLETVQSFLAEDGIYRVMPLTGAVSDSGIPLRYKVLCLPTLYAVLCNVFGIEASLLVCHIVPVLVLAGAYICYYGLSGVLFPKSDLRKRYLFLFVIALFFIFMDRGTFANGYSVLHAGYLGTSIRNLVLVPYTLTAVLERHWWKAVLCVLAEACIVWTFWGLGVCIVILTGMCILSLLERKCPRISGFIQIFRNKEDLT